jgi:hypothetical protein
LPKKFAILLEDLNEVDVKEIKKLNAAVPMEDHLLSVDYIVLNVFTGGSSLTSINEEVEYLENIRGYRCLLYHKSRPSLESTIMESSLLKYSNSNGLCISS